MKKTSITHLLNELHNLEVICSSQSLLLHETIIPLVLKMQEKNKLEIKEAYCQGLLDSEKFYNENYF